MIEKFVTTSFSNEERHIRRIEKIGMLEKWN
jgi:ribose 5-phosphate isomerase RpiB